MIPIGLRDNIIYQTSRLTKRFSDSLSRAFKESGYDITSEQFTVLTVLWYQDGIPQQQIAKTIERDKTTVRRVISSMIKRDLIKKEDAVQDRREKHIYLTEKGKIIQKDLIKRSGDIFFKTTSGIDDRDLQIALSVIHKMIGNIKE